MVSESVCIRQWVESVGNSTQYAPTNAYVNILGQPNETPWQIETSEALATSIELYYKIPVYVMAINIHETANAGGVVEIEAFNPDRSTWKTLWSVKTAEAVEGARIFSPDVRLGRPFRTHLIRLSFSCMECTRSIDAVELEGYSYYGETEYEAAARNLAVRNQFVSEVLSFSSEYNTSSWAAANIVGEPKVFPRYGDIAGTWATGVYDAHQYIEVRYETPVHPIKLRLYETYKSGCVISVEGFDTSANEYRQLWKGNTRLLNYSRIFEPLLKVNDKQKYDRFKVYLDCSRAATFCEIDCIELVGTDEIEP